jgi:hypothetical protein
MRAQMDDSNRDDRSAYGKDGRWHNVGERTYKERWGNADWDKYSASQFPDPMPKFTAWTRAELIAKSAAVGGSVGAAIPLATRMRPTHKHGVGAAGTVKIVDDPKFPAHEFFAAGRVFEARVRHATLRFLDDAALDGRSAALKFADTDGDAPLAIHMNSGGALFWSVNSVFDFNLATTLNRLDKYLHEHPAAWTEWVDTVRRDPESFARCSFNGVHVYGFNTADGRTMYCKYRQVPWDNWTSIADDTGLPDWDDQGRMWIGDRLANDPRPTDYLRAEYKARMARDGMVRHRLQIQVKAFDERTDTQEFFNGAKQWDVPWLELAEVTMTRVLDDEVTERSWWDIANRPASLPIVEAYSNDDYNGICWTRARWYARSAKARQAFGVRKADHVSPGTSYHIVIQTHDSIPATASAGAHLKMRLTGANGHSDPFTIDVDPNDLKAGRIADYVVVLRDLGDLKSLEIDGAAMLSEWHVAEIAVVCESEAGVERWYFPCNTRTSGTLTVNAEHHPQPDGQTLTGCPFSPTHMRRNLNLVIKSGLGIEGPAVQCTVKCPTSGFEQSTEPREDASWDTEMRFELASESGPVEIEVRNAKGSVGSISIDVQALALDRYFTRHYAIHTGGNDGGASLLIRTYVKSPAVAPVAGAEQVPQDGQSESEQTRKYLEQKRKHYDFSRTFAAKDITIDARYRDDVGKTIYPLVPAFIADFDLAVAKEQIWALSTVGALAKNGIKSQLDSLLNKARTLVEKGEERMRGFFAKLGLGKGDKLPEFASVEQFGEYLVHLYADHLFEFVGKRTPILEHWIIDDEEFGRQRLGGVNSMEIAKYPGTDADIRALATGIDDLLIAARAEGRLFWCDYTEWMTCVSNHQQGKFGIGDGAHVFLVLEGEPKRLMPKAIRLERDGLWFRPEHGFAWLFAKLYIQSCDAQDQGTRLHLFYTHLLAETTAIAMQRNFDERHPLRVLLSPHLIHTMSINELSRKTMFIPGGLVDGANAGGRIGTLMQINNALRKLTFTDLAFPRNIAMRGVDEDSLPISFPYRDDCREMWNTMELLASTIVDAFYPTDAVVAADPQLRGFVTELSAHQNQGGRELVDVYDPNLTLQGSAERYPTSIVTRKHLTEFLTTLIYTSSFQHGAVNNPQFDFYGFIPNCFTSMNGAPPRSLEVTPQQILDALGTTAQSLYQMAFIFEMTTENHETIFHDAADEDYVQRCYGFASPEGRAAISAYYQRMVQARAANHARSLEREAQFFASHPNAKDAPYSVTYAYIDPCKVDLTIQV